MATSLKLEADPEDKNLVILQSLICLLRESCATRSRHGSSIMTAIRCPARWKAHALRQPKSRRSVTISDANTAGSIVVCSNAAERSRTLRG